VPAGGQTRPSLIPTGIAALWGSYPVFAKIALVHFPPYVLVALRTSLASSFLAVLLLGGLAVLAGVGLTTRTSRAS
jgi:hypothetical protein